MIVFGTGEAGSKSEGASVSAPGQHEPEIEPGQHANNVRLLSLSLSPVLRRGFGFLVLALIVGGFTLTVLGAVTHELGATGVVVLARGALMSFIWLVASVFAMF